MLSLFSSCTDVVNKYFNPVVYFLGVFVGEGWRKGTFGVGFLLKNHLQGLYPYGQGVGGQLNEDRRGQEGGSKINENVQTSFTDGPYSK